MSTEEDSDSRTKGNRTMSKSTKRKILKSMQQKMGIDPTAKALEIAMKNARGFTAKSNGAKPTDKPQ